MGPTVVVFCTGLQFFNSGRFLGGSPKRTAILKRHLPDAKQVDYLVGDTDDEKVESNINISNAFSKNLLPKLCETIWSARVDALSVILAKYKAIYFLTILCINESLVHIAF
jgi:hypothetical protein